MWCCLQVLATSGAICSASVTVFFGAKRLCDKVVTDMVSCRKVGDPDEFVRVSVLGVGVKEVLEASPKGAWKDAARQGEVVVWR